MTAAIAIEPAQVVDAWDIAAVHVRSWHETYPGLIPPAVLARLSADRLALDRARVIDRGDPTLVVRIDDAVGGFASGGSARRQRGFDGEIYELYLLREHHRRGIGRALFKAMVGRLGALGHASFMLWVLDGNPAAGFYARMGGRAFARKTERVGGAPLVHVGYGWDDLSDGLTGPR